MNKFHSIYLQVGKEDYINSSVIGGKKNNSYTNEIIQPDKLRCLGRRRFKCGNHTETLYKMINEDLRASVHNFIYFFAESLCAHLWLLSRTVGVTDHENVNRRNIL